MDSDTRRENGIVDSSRFQELLVHRLHDALGRQRFSGGRLLDSVLVGHGDRFGVETRNGDGVLLLQLGLLLQPFRGFRDQVLLPRKSLVHRTQEVLSRGVHKEVGFDLLALFGQANINVYDASHTELGRLLGTGNETAHPPRDTIVESGADVDDEIGFLDQEIRCGVTVHAHKVQGQIVPFVETPQGVEGGAHGNLEFLREFFELDRAVVASLPGDDDRLLRPSDEFKHVGRDLVVQIQISFLGDRIRFPRESIRSPENLIRDVVIRVETVGCALHGFQFEIILVVDLEGQALFLVSESDGLEGFAVFSARCVNTCHATGVVGLSVGNIASHVLVDHLGRKDLVLQIFG
mmetsp:Transcript_13518/g.31793  ORF Transcript_13518/g.31793 Transcript_13518/m.31793 type:complete len:349 (-) Transcript_13518:1147-2193(-)